MIVLRALVAAAGILTVGMTDGAAMAAAQETPQEMQKETRREQPALSGPVLETRPGPEAAPTRTAAPRSAGKAARGRGAEAGGCPLPAVAAPGSGARWAGDGSLALADGRRLVVRGVVLPSRLAGPDGPAAEAAAGTVLADALVHPAPVGTDRHGRLVGDAVLAAPGAAPLSLATALLRAGAGYADPAGAPECAPLAAEAEARQARRGLWAVAGASAPAGDVARLSGRTGVFTLVEGRVRAAGATRERVFLNFGERWREDFTVMLAKEDFATIFGDGLEPAQLKGRWVRARGVIRQDGGPAITVGKAGQVEQSPGMDER